MSDTSAAMREFRFLDEKRKHAQLSAAEEQRYHELRHQLGMPAQTPPQPQGYYADDGNWYPYPAAEAYPQSYDPNAQAYGYAGYDPNAQAYGYGQQQPYDPYAAQHDPNAAPAYDPAYAYPQQGYDPNAYGYGYPHPHGQPQAPPGYYGHPHADPHYGWQQPPAPEYAHDPQ